MVGDHIYEPFPERPQTVNVVQEYDNIQCSQGNQACYQYDVYCQCNIVHFFYHRLINPKAGTVPSLLIYI